MSHPHASYPRHSGGFTLLELLVVLVIISILLAFAVINLRPPGAGKLVEREAQRLEALLRLASDEAVLRARTYGVRLRADGYTFVAREDGAWRNIEDAPLARRRLEGTVRLEVPRAKRTARPDDAPHLWLFPDGQMTPFELDLYSASSRLRLVGTETGELRIDRP